MVESIVTGNPLVAVDEMGLLKFIWFKKTSTDKEIQKKLDFENWLASRYPNNDSYCSIYTHGIPVGKQAGAWLTYGNTYLKTAKEVKEKLINSGCKTTMPVRMYSCRTGVDGAIAQNLSLIWDSTVIAPNQRIGYISTDYLEPVTFVDANHKIINGQYVRWYKGKR